MSRLLQPFTPPPRVPRRTALAVRALCLTLACLIVALPAFTQPSRSPETPIRGLSEGWVLARTYDAILNADFDDVGPRLADACDTVPAWCAVMRVVALWWQIMLDPEERRHDALFRRELEGALALTDAWIKREPLRAEAWFAHGAALGARAQWRVQRRERLAAARDGKQIRVALERALALDPGMADARFGIGLYRYYADVAPAALRVLRWLLLLPGGDRVAGLQEMQRARDEGVMIRGEADYQLHLVYLWYENRPHDALALIRSLQQRYPRNPLFALNEAHIHAVYFHDPATSEIVLRALLDRVDAARVNAPEVARRRARAQLDALVAPRAH